MTKLTERLDALRSADVLDYDTYSELHDMAIALMRAASIPPGDEAAEEQALFERLWTASGRQYGSDALRQVRLGWDMARGVARAKYTAEVADLKETLNQLSTPRENFSPSAVRELLDLIARRFTSEFGGEPQLRQYAKRVRESEVKK